MKAKEDVKDIDIIEKHWDDYSPEFDEAHATEDIDLWREELFKLTGEKKGLKVLDIGTGTGFLALMMAELGNEVYGVDVSEGMMNIGKEHAKERNVDVKFIKNEGENLQFDDDFFDVVVNCRVLWTLVDPDVSFKEWKRVMKPGGKVISFIRDSKGMHKPKKEFIYSKELDEKLPLRKADEKTYMEYMERAGFKNSKVIRMREDLTVKREADDNKKMSPWLAVYGEK